MKCLFVPFGLRHFKERVNECNLRNTLQYIEKDTWQYLFYHGDRPLQGRGGIKIRYYHHHHHHHQYYY